MSTGKEHLRLVSSDRNKRALSPEIPWKTIALTSAIASIAGFAALEFAKYLVGRMKKPAEDEKVVSPNPMRPLALPGAVSPNMFPNPYSQMQGFPAPFANPMMLPEADEPPKWFMAFKEQYDKDQVRLSTLEKQSVKSRAARLALVDDEEDEADED